MKKILVIITLLGFFLFIVGGVLLVGIQAIGLFIGKADYIVKIASFFKWIYPCAAISGLLSYFYSYLKKGES